MSIRWLVPIAAASWRRLRSAIPASRAWRTAAASRRSRACEAGIPKCTIRYMFHLVQGGRQMTRLRVEAEGVTRAAPEAVWVLVANADRYGEGGPWSGGGSQDLGGQAPDGAGVIRWFRYGRTVTVEQVLESERPRRLVYTVVKGIPVRNYRAEVTLTPQGEGTHICWVATWDRTLPGRIVHSRLRTIYPHVVSRLIAAAAESSARPAQA